MCARGFLEARLRGGVVAGAIQGGLLPAASSYISEVGRSNPYRVLQKVVVTSQKNTRIAHIPGSKFRFPEHHHRDSDKRYLKRLKPTGSPQDLRNTPGMLLCCLATTNTVTTVCKPALFTAHALNIPCITIITPSEASDEERQDVVSVYSSSP